MDPPPHPLASAKDHRTVADSSTRISETSKSDPGTKSGENRSGHRKRSGTHLNRKRSKKSSSKTRIESQTTSIHSTPSSNVTSQPSSVPSSAARSPPVSKVWVPGGVTNTNEADRTTVIIYCAKNLWHSIKFITDKEYQLRYSTSDKKSICYNVLTGLQMNTGLDRRVWWESKCRRWISAGITNLRNSKMTALKSAFFGKSWK